LVQGEREKEREKEIEIENVRNGISRIERKAR
jgi:hypothetical protein